MKTFLFFLFLCSNAFGWSPEVVKKWNEFSETHKKVLHESTFATFWGGLRRAMHWNDHKGELKDLAVPGFRKPVRIYLSTQNKKADLYLFYPGVFGKPDGKITPLMIDVLEKQNGHVIVIPDIVAETYLVARPVLKGDNLANERLNQNAILREALKLIPDEKIGKIHLIGESLGSFQAANLDFKFDSMTLLWPPIYLDRSVARFDFLIKKNLPVVNRCSYWWKWPQVAYEVKWLNIPKELTEEDRVCLGAWVISEGFVTSIKKTSAFYLEEHNKAVPDIYTFSEFVKTVLPDFSILIETKDEKLSLIHLLKAVKTSPLKIRITSSVDDFLNDPKEWDELLAVHPELKSNFYLHEWGGHCGPIGIDGFMESVLSNL
jgi:hypothetical protein